MKKVAAGIATIAAVIAGVFWLVIGARSRGRDAARRDIEQAETRVQGIRDRVADAQGRADAARNSQEAAEREFAELEHKESSIAENAAEASTGSLAASLRKRGV